VKPSAAAVPLLLTKHRAGRLALGASGSTDAGRCSEHDTARHGTAQHSTAQHSLHTGAQHSFMILCMASTTHPACYCQLNIPPPIHTCTSTGMAASGLTLAAHIPVQREQPKLIVGKKHLHGWRPLRTSSAISYACAFTLHSLSCTTPPQADHIRTCMLFLHTPRLTVANLPQPVAAVDMVYVCLAAGQALLLTHGCA
jgi:hypothetical protein